MTPLTFSRRGEHNDTSRRSQSDLVVSPQLHPVVSPGAQFLQLEHVVAREGDALCLLGRGGAPAGLGAGLGAGYLVMRRSGVSGHPSAGEQTFYYC